MGNELDAFTTTPTLTLDPFADEKAPAAPVITAEPEKPIFDESVLTAEERHAVEQFAEKIDLTNSQMILQYGAGTQKKMADFSESFIFYRCCFLKNSSSKSAKNLLKVSA